MKTKLTLSIDSEILKLAKEFAASRRISLSFLLENYLSGFIKQSPKYKPSKYVKQIPAKEPSYPEYKKNDDKWLEENLNI